MHQLQMVNIFLGKISCGWPWEKSSNILCPPEPEKQGHNPILSRKSGVSWSNQKKCIDPSVNCPVISCDWNICLCWTRSKVINMSMGNDIWFSMIGLWRFCYSLQIWSNDLWDIHWAKTSVQWFLMTRLIDDWQTTFLSLRQSIYRHIIYDNASLYIVYNILKVALMCNVWLKWKDYANHRLD